MQPLTKEYLQLISVDRKEKKSIYSNSVTDYIKHVPDQAPGTGIVVKHKADFIFVSFFISEDFGFPAVQFIFDIILVFLDYFDFHVFCFILFLVVEKGIVNVGNSQL